MCLMLIRCDWEKLKYCEQLFLLSVPYISQEFFSTDVGRNVYLLKAENSWAFFPLEPDNVVLGFNGAGISTPSVKSSKGDFNILKVIAYCGSFQNLEDETVLSVNINAWVPLSHDCEVTWGMIFRDAPEIQSMDMIEAVMSQKYSC